MSDILPDYIPETFDRSLPPVSENQRIVIDTVDSENQKLELSWPQKVLWLGEAPADSVVTWNIADFPGWRYYVNDQEVNAELLADGRRQFTSAEPVSSAGAVFTMTPVRQYTALVSAIAWILWFALALPWKKESSSKANHAS
ncbi:hypothetical protein LRY60_02695 [Candidatus Woesebacteria bacterium]|nr:hypothetical protein [Candidatus Woesebacteria bacterium]